MKILIVNLQGQTFLPSYELPEGLTGEQFRILKRDYDLYFSRYISEQRNKIRNCRKVLIDLDNLPKLSNRLDDLKGFMKSFEYEFNECEKPVLLWNQKREVAKNFFTAPCIRLLDASGFINELIPCNNVKQ